MTELENMLWKEIDRLRERVRRYADDERDRLAQKSARGREGNATEERIQGIGDIAGQALAAAGNLAERVTALENWRPPEKLAPFEERIDELERRADHAAQQRKRIDDRIDDLEERANAQGGMVQGLIKRCETIESSIRERIEKAQCEMISYTDEAIKADQRIGGAANLDTRLARIETALTSPSGLQARIIGVENALNAAGPSQLGSQLSNLVADVKAIRSRIDADGVWDPAAGPRCTCAAAFQFTGRQHATSCAMFRDEP